MSLPLQGYYTPIYNLGAVVQETGVKADTLRAWERRYGLPHPERTTGRHRLYSQRDVDIVKWLVARQQEGLSIRQAVELWRAQEAGDREALPAPTTRGAPAAGDALVDLRAAWVSACLAFDKGNAEQVVLRAFALYPPETVCLDLLLKGLAEVGQDWYKGHVTVQQEHFASELAMRRVETLMEAAAAPVRPGRIMTACPPEEEHIFPVLLLTFLLRRRGWDVLYLGANVPVEQMTATITATRPQLVIFGAQQLYTAANLLAMARVLLHEDIPLGFGGGIFNRLPALPTCIPGYFLGLTLEQALSAAEELMVTPRPAPPVEPPAQGYEVALVHYRERQLLIDAGAWEHMQAQGIAPDVPGWAGRRLACCIVAALSLGNIAFLDGEMAWLRCMGGDLTVSPGLLGGFLQAYYQAAREHLDERGAPVVDWLARQVNSGITARSL